MASAASTITVNRDVYEEALEILRKLENELAVLVDKEKDKTFTPDELFAMHEQIFAARTKLRNQLPRMSAEVAKLFNPVLEGGRRRTRRARRARRKGCSRRSRRA